MEWETIKFGRNSPFAKVIHTGTYSECIEWRQRGNGTGGLWGSVPLVLMSRNYFDGKDAYGVRFKKKELPVTNFGFIS